jgi:hypothetical protein
MSRQKLVLRFSKPHRTKDKRQKDKGEKTKEKNEPRAWI